MSATERPYTRRGVLSIINSLYDLLGFAAPVGIRGRALLRELTTEAGEWDDPLPERKLREWCEWRNSLKDLEHVRLPRMYTSISLSSSTNRELCIFCDASTQAIGAVAYIKVTNVEGKSELGFVLDKVITFFFIFRFRLQIVIWSLTLKMKTLLHARAALLRCKVELIQ